MRILWFLWLFFLSLWPFDFDWKLLKQNANFRKSIKLISLLQSYLEELKYLILLIWQLCECKTSVSHRGFCLFSVVWETTSCYKSPLKEPGMKPVWILQERVMTSLPNLTGTEERMSRFKYYNQIILKTICDIHNSQHLFAELECLSQMSWFRLICFNGRRLMWL